MSCGLFHAPNDPVSLSALPWPLLGSEKLNGFRLCVFGDELLTKAMKPHINRNLREHFAGLLDLAKRRRWVFDCELYVAGLSLAEIQGILQSPTAAIPQSMSAHVFDFLTLGQWIGDRAPRYERRIELAAAVIAEHRPAHVQVLETRQLSGASAAASWYDRIRATGGEGLFLRNPSGRYKHGRATPAEQLAWKVKPSTLTPASPSVRV